MVIAVILRIANNQNQLTGHVLIKLIPDYICHCTLKIIIIIYIIHTHISTTAVRKAKDDKISSNIWYGNYLKTNLEVTLQLRVNIALSYSFTFGLLHAFQIY